MLYDKWFGIYKVREAGWRDVLKYVIPVVVSFLVIAAYFFYRRVVEHRQAERLILTNRALEQTNRMKSEFMANVTHELRTPLNSVIGFAGLLKDEVPGPLNAKQAAFVADILAGGQHLLALVEGILEMSRLDAAGAALEREPVEIGAALEERVAAHGKAAEARGVKMRLDVAPEAGSADLDPKALRRLAEAHGGTIDVESEPGKGSTFTLRLALREKP